MLVFGRKNNTQVILCAIIIIKSTILRGAIMYISKQSKKLLKAAMKNTPTIQGKYYSAVELSRSHHICNDGEAVLIAKALEENGLAVLPYSSCPELFYLTEAGLHYNEFCFHMSLEFFKRSIICPIAVTLITEATIHGVPILLRMILQQG